MSQQLKEAITAEQENDKYEKPCPYNEAVLCVQYPGDSCGCNPCEECEIKIKNPKTPKGE